MMQTEFYDIKQLINTKNWVKNDESHKILWKHIMEVSVSHSQPTILKYKYDFDAEYSQLNTESVKKTRSKRCSTQIISPSPELQVLYTEALPISKALYEDLMSLCRAGDIPNYYHGFFESLTYANSSSGSNDVDTDDD